MTAQVIDFAAYKAAREGKMPFAGDGVTYTDIPMEEFKELSEEELRSFFAALQSCWRE